MRGAGLSEAVRAAGGVGALARALGISQPAVSGWQKVPADRVLAVEALTRIPRFRLRPDLYPREDSLVRPDSSFSDVIEAVDELNRVRAQHYGLLSLLLGRAPNADLLFRLAALEGGDTALGRAHSALASAARATDANAVSREYFDLFVGIGRGEFLPYASYYLTGFLNERPLAGVREDLARLGIERSEGVSEPEDHVAILFDTMASLVSGQVRSVEAEQQRFFARHIEPWAGRFLRDLTTSRTARFYGHVGELGVLFLEIESEAFALEA